MKEFFMIWAAATAALAVLAVMIAAPVYAMVTYGSAWPMLAYIPAVAFLVAISSLEPS